MSQPKIRSILPIRCHIEALLTYPAVPATTNTQEGDYLNP